MTITELEQSKKQFLTAKEAADFIGMSIRTLYDLCDEDELPFRVVKMRGRWYVPKRSFLMFVKDE